MASRTQLLNLFTTTRLEWDPTEEPVTFTRSVEDIRGCEIHHTGGVGPKSMSFEHKAKWCLQIEKYHEWTKRWSDIFYHVFIFADGEIWEGRDARRTSQGNISNALTVHIPGNDPKLTAAQRASLVKVLRTIGGYVRDHQSRPASTYCAGDNLRAELPSLREAAGKETSVSSDNLLSPQDLSTHPDYTLAVEQGLIGSTDPGRVASRSVVGVVVARVWSQYRNSVEWLKAEIKRVDVTATSRISQVEARCAALSSRLNQVEAELSSRLDVIEANPNPAERSVKEIADQLEVRARDDR